MANHIVYRALYTAGGVVGATVWGAILLGAFVRHWYRQWGV